MSPEVQAFRSRWRMLLKVALFILLIISANFFSAWIIDALRMEIRPSNEEFVHRVIMAAAIAYALLIAIPFVPGIEIALTLISMLGSAIVFLLYVSTLAGLSLSFVVGRVVSLTWLARLFDEFHLHGASQLLDTIEPMDRDERLNHLVSKAPNRLIPFLLRHRYLALALVVNLPGNIVIGGGGGISLMAGASRLYSAPGFFITIAIAVSPIPIALLLFGNTFLPS